MAMYLVDGVRLFRRAYDLDRGSKREFPTVGFANAQMIRFNPALYASSARYSSGKRLLVVIGADLDIRRQAESTLPVPADGAGGLRLR